MKAQIAVLAAAVRTAERVLAFTGAGISTASGIPDFRGPGGVWTRRRPVLFQDFLASEEARRAHWKYKAEGHAEFAQARPNAAHRALVALERLGKLDTLVTQNVDGLHQDAGHDPERIVELHGTNRLVECLSCGQRSAPEPALEDFRATGECPRCRACGGILKTATVSFGQPMPQAELQRAFRAVPTWRWRSVPPWRCAPQPTCRSPPSATAPATPSSIAGPPATTGSPTCAWRGT